MIRVLICDDQEIVRDGLGAMLKTDPRITITGAARDGEEALELIEKSPPDLVLMDLKMPGMNGIQATREITRRHPEVKVLVLTTYDGDEWVFDALKGGAAGYLLKDTPREQLLSAITGTLEGKTHLDPSIAGKLLPLARKDTRTDSTLTANLGEREREILSLLAKGLSNSEIAARLFLSEGTIRNYVSSLFEKLGVPDRTQAAILAIRCGLGND
jgi:DNA-binding NarL/FixJ family response regulator